MLIDDNYATNYLHRLVIEESSRIENIVIAQSADIALSILSNKIKMPEIIFLDINMPGKNGWEFLEEFSEIVNNKSETVQVIILSTSDHPNDKMMVGKYNFIKDYKVKPLTVPMINEIVNSFYN